MTPSQSSLTLRPPSSSALRPAAARRASLGGRLTRASISVTGIALTTSLAFVGCAQDEPTMQRVQIAPAAIQGGFLDSSDTAVVGVLHLTNSGIGSCTGSLLSENVVLTAIHCVASTPSQIQCPSQVFNTNNANDMFITTATTMPQSLNGYHGVREIVLPPGSGFCGRDVAIMILDSPLSGSEAVPLLPRNEALQEGEIYSAVGYGEQGEGGPSQTRMRRDNLALLCVGNLCGAPDAVYAAEWVGETAVCSGDSGGPALDSQGRVTGVASRGAAGCEQPVYGNVYTHLDWIKSTTVYAAGLAGLTPPSWSTETTGNGAGPSGAGGGAGVGGGGAGVGGASSSSSSGNGVVPGDAEDKKFSGEVLSSCAADPTRTPRSSWPALALLGVAAAWVSRRRRR